MVPPLSTTHAFPETAYRLPRKKALPPTLWLSLSALRRLGPTHAPRSPKRLAEIRPGATIRPPAVSPHRPTTYSPRARGRRAAAG